MRASVVVLAHGPEPHLAACIRAVLDQQPFEVLLVDNDAAPAAVAEVAALPGVRVLRPGRNLGYAGGCNHAAAEALGDVLAFVNSDAVLGPGALAALLARVADPSVGLVSGSIRLADAPEQLNSAGNPVHFLMFSWAGSFGEPAAAHGELTEVASISGAAFAVRREVWEQLGGFDPTYFAYCEDVDLSLRAWQAGYRVVHEPTAVVLHHFEYGRHAAKHYLLERNRLLNLLVLPERRTRRLLAVPALAVEAGVLAVAVRDGWAGDKVAGWRWLVANRGAVRRRRRAVQAARVVPDAALVARLRGPLDPPEGLGTPVPAPVVTALDRYWTWARRRIEVPR